MDTGSPPGPQLATQEWTSVVSELVEELRRLKPREDATRRHEQSNGIFREFVTGLPQRAEARDLDEPPTDEFLTSIAPTADDPWR